MKKYIFATLGCAISAWLIWSLFSDINWTTFLAELRRFNVYYLPVLFLIFCSSIWIRSYRWKYLLNSNGHLPLNSLYRATIIGIFANFILPLRAGEVVRPWVLGRIAPVSVSAGLASIVTERMFDVLTLLVLLSFSLSGVPSVPPEITLGAKALGIFVSIVVVGLVIVYFWGESIETMLSKIIKIIFKNHSDELVEKIHRVISELIHGLRAIKTFKDLIIVSTLSLLLWITYAAFNQALILGFNIQLGLEAGMLVALITGIVIAAPSAPGFIGTFQLGYVIGLSYIYHQSEELALGFSIVSHVFQIVLSIILGVMAMKSTGLGFSALHADDSARRS